MKGIYKVFKREIQGAIKEIAEKHGIAPANVLLTLQGDVFSEYATKLEEIAKRLSSNFDIDIENIFQMAEEFNSEVQTFICPEYNCTNGNSLYAYLNRQLVEAGYQTVNPETLELLIDEIQGMRIHKEAPQT